MSNLQCPTTLLVARHGEAAYEGQTWSDAGGSLTPLGRAQSAHLAEESRPRKVAYVYASTMARAVQTGEIAAARLGVPAVTREALREFAVGDFAGSRAKDPFAPTYRRWLAGELDARLPGGETGAELVARMHGVLEEIADLHRGETVLVISHGGVLRLALPLLLTRQPVDPPARLANGAAVAIRMDGDDWICEHWPAAVGEVQTPTTEATAGPTSGPTSATTPRAHTAP